MKFDLDGQTYEFKDDRISFAEFRYLKRELGLSSSEFLGGLLRLDVEALAGAVLLTMKRRSVADPSAPVFTAADLDDVDMLALINSVAAHGQADSAAANADAEEVAKEVEEQAAEPPAKAPRKRA